MVEALWILKIFSQRSASILYAKKSGKRSSPRVGTLRRPSLRTDGIALCGSLPPRIPPIKKAGEIISGFLVKTGGYLLSQNL
jgi:hypothetical protein